MNTREMEKQIIEKAVECLLNAGFTLRVDDGGDDYATPWTTEAAVVMDALMNTDGDHLFAHKDGHTKSITLVYGNDGYDVLADYSISLEEVLRPANELADQLEQIH